MDLRIKLSSLDLASGSRTSVREIDEAGLPRGTLEDLFDHLARRHPDLAPLLEDAVHQKDLEIAINNRRLHEGAEETPLRDGDVVSLFVKPPA